MIRFLKRRENRGLALGRGLLQTEQMFETYKEFRPDTTDLPFVEELFGANAAGFETKSLHKLTSKVLYDLRWPCRPIKGAWRLWFEYLRDYGLKPVPPVEEYVGRSKSWTADDVIRGEREKSE